MSADLEGLILGHCLMAWAKTHKEGKISSRTFSRKENRDIYLAAKKQGPGEGGSIDVAMLSQSLNSSIPADYIPGILTGIPQSDRRNVPRYLKQLTLGQVCGKISRFLQDGVETGEFPDEEAEALLQEVISAQKSAAGSGLVSRRISEIDPEPIEWLWHNRIPLGKLSILAGDPGTGKSFFSLFMAAQITKGLPWPDIGAPTMKGSVILMSAEDDAADTIRPRLDAAGADVRKIVLVEGVRSPGKNEIDPFCVENSDLLQDVAKDLPDLRLVILDPLSFYMGAGIDMAKDNKVRGSLEPLQRFAADRKVAILAVTHLNKNSAMTQALYRVRDSLAFVATARSSWILSRDPEDQEVRRFVPLKCNLSIKPSGLEFEIQEGRLVFSENRLEMSAEESLHIPEIEPEPGLRVLEAVEFLKDALKEGPEPVTDLLKLAELAGIHEKLMRSAKKSLNLIQRKTGYQGKNTWELSEADN